MRSGVKTPSGVTGARSHSPPRGRVSVAVVVMVFPRAARYPVEAVSRAAGQSLSKMPAAPMPPPTHMVTMP